MPTTTPPNSILALGYKELHVGHAVIVVPDRAVQRWTANPEQLHVMVDGQVTVYDANGDEIPNADSSTDRFSESAPFSPWSTHPSVVPVPAADE